MASLASRLAPLGTAQIFLYAQNVDMRKSFDGLHAIIQAELEPDALGGDLATPANFAKRLARLAAKPPGFES